MIPEELEMLGLIHLKFFPLSWCSLDEFFLICFIFNCNVQQYQPGYTVPPRPVAEETIIDIGWG